MIRRKDIMRILAVLLAMSMLLGGSLTAFAAEQSYAEPSDAGYVLGDYEKAYGQQAIVPFSGSIFSGGTGQQGNPFRLMTAQDILDLGDFTSGFRAHPDFSQAFLNSAHYILMADIDMQFNPNFVPIGMFQTNGFNGTFDGAIFTISNLMVNFDRPFMPFISGIEAVGFFAFANNATIRNVNVRNIDVRVLGQAREDVGGLIGFATSGSLSNSSIQGGSIDASAASNVGGLVGRANSDFIVQNSFVDGVDITGNNSVGGVAGNITNTVIVRYCSNSNGSITGYGNNVGGVVGTIAINAVVHDSYSNNNTVAGVDNVGGVFGNWIAGNTVAVRLHGNFSRGDVSGQINVGGVGGHMSNTSTAVKTVSNSYAVGTVYGVHNVGGIIGLINNNAGANSRNTVISDNYSHADLRGSINVGGIVGSAAFRSNISRNYASSRIEVSGNNAGGIVGHIAGNSGTNANTHISILDNNMAIVDIIAPSAATATGILIGLRGVNVTPTNNRFSFDSTISGGAAQNFTLATRAYALELGMPDWWNNVLLINEADAFDTTRLREGFLPTVLRFGSTEEVPHQLGRTFSGTDFPTAESITYIIGSGVHRMMNVTTSGALVVRVDGLTVGRDYFLAGNTIIFNAVFLESLGVGSHFVVITLNSGQKINGHITVGTGDAPHFYNTTARFTLATGFPNGISFVYRGTTDNIVAIHQVTPYARTLTLGNAPNDGDFRIIVSGGNTEIWMNAMPLIALDMGGHGEARFNVVFSNGAEQMITAVIDPFGT